MRPIGGAPGKPRIYLSLTWVNAETRRPRENVAMNSRQLRAMADYFRVFHDADAFLKALDLARSLCASGELQTADVWNRIAEEISQIQTSAILDQRLGAKSGEQPAV